MPEKQIVEDDSAPRKGESPEQQAWVGQAPSSREIKECIRAHIADLFAFLDKRGDNRCFHSVEKGTVARVFALGRLFLAYFLALREERSSGDVKACGRKGFLERDPQPRWIGTFFGKVRYWRTYMRLSGGGGGIYPLDVALELTRDGFSMWIMSLAARLATLVSFDQVTALLLRFLFWSPSKTTVEKAVLGLGRYTGAWFEAAPPPSGDGEVLVIQIDSKATPTATEEELKKRRGKRRPNPFPESRRHRGREKRKHRGRKRRRKKGDKAKNGKMATLVVMYTLRRTVDDEGNPVLLGPLNVKVYGSYAAKRHAFAVARREADKRGFTKDSGKRIQIVTDGDNDLERYVKEFFPEAVHTLDVIHVIERIWKAGECLHPEGSEELEAAVEDMKELLYSGKIKELIAKLQDDLEQIPKTGPGNKGRRNRLCEIIGYLSKRIHMMNYDWLTAEDLEIATGAVEGAVKHVVAKRFDNGSMRWIKERAEPLLQLRCIEVNEDWQPFIAFVRARLRQKTREDLDLPTVLTNKAIPLPTFGVTS